MAGAEPCIVKSFIVDSLMCCARSPSRSSSALVAGRLYAFAVDSVGIDLKALARLTPGFVGADLSAVVKEAGVIAIHRLMAEGAIQRPLTSKEMLTKKDAPTDIGSTLPAERLAGGAAKPDGANTELLGGVVGAGGEEAQSQELSDSGAPAQVIRHQAVQKLSSEQMKSFFVEMDDLREAVTRVQPTAKREGFATVPGSCCSMGSLNKLQAEHECCFCSAQLPGTWPEAIMWQYGAISGDQV